MNETTTTISATPQIRGRVIAVADVQESQSGKFRWRTVAVETGYKYSNPIGVRFTQDNVAKLDGIRTGDNVTIKYRLDGREWNGRYLVDVTGTDIECQDAAKRAPAQTANAAAAVDAWKAKHGGRIDVEAFKALCAEVCPKVAEYAAGRGAKFSECAQPSDWGLIVDRINGKDEAVAEPEVVEDDEFPF